LAARGITVSYETIRNWCLKFGQQYGNQVFAYLSETEKEGAINTFFVKVREELDIIPAKVQVLEYMQENAVFKDEQGTTTMKAAEVIKHPVPKAMGSINLMTYIIIAKYADGMPLYRLEGIIERYGAAYQEQHTPTMSLR
jgi:transposase